MYSWNSDDSCTLTVLNDSIKLQRGSLPIFAGNFIDFKGTVTRLCNLEHFYMLMNNSGIIILLYLELQRDEEYLREE